MVRTLFRHPDRKWLWIFSEGKTSTIFLGFPQLCSLQEEYRATKTSPELYWSTVSRSGPTKECWCCGYQPTDCNHPFFKRRFQTSPYAINTFIGKHAIKRSLWCPFAESSLPLEGETVDPVVVLIQAYSTVIRITVLLTAYTII